MNLTKIRKFFIDHIAARTGLPVIWANQNSPRPANEYITIQIINMTIPQYDWEAPVSCQGKSAFFGEREMTLSVHYIGGFDLSVLDDLGKSFAEYDTRLLMQPIPLSYIRAEGITDTTVVLDKQYEQRFTMDLRFYTNTADFENVKEFDVGWVETVEIEQVATSDSGEEHTSIINAEREQEQNNSDI